MKTSRKSKNTSSRSNAARRDPYRDAGVNIEAGDAVVDWLLNTGKSKTSGSRGAKGVRRVGEIVSGIGGFAGLFRPEFKRCKDPLLVASTDGVGTKLLLGLEHNALEGLGQDLVAMCANDLYTIGARPMFFLDYYATGKLDPKQFRSVLTGIRNSCNTCSMALLGGETAELPGLYEGKHFDLAGFVVGLVDGRNHLGPQHVKAGDILYAVESSGFHSNGYSLIRKWLSRGKGRTPKSLISRILAPTRLYPEIPQLLDELGTKGFHALANITGGGISGNLPRVLPNGTTASIVPALLPTQKWMREFIDANTDSWRDVEHVFNLGAGMIAVVPKSGTARFERAAHNVGLAVHAIGDVRKGRGEAKVVYND